MHLSNPDLLNILGSANCVDATTHDGIDLYFHLQSIFIPRYMGCSSRQVFAHQGHSSVTSPCKPWKIIPVYFCLHLSSTFSILAQMEISPRIKQRCTIDWKPISRNLNCAIVQYPKGMGLGDVKADSFIYHTLNKSFRSCLPEQWTSIIQ